MEWRHHPAWGWQSFRAGGQYAYRLRYQYTDDGVLYTEDKSGRIAVIR